VEFALIAYIARTEFPDLALRVLAPALHERRDDLMAVDQILGGPPGKRLVVEAEVSEGPAGQAQFHGPARPVVLEVAGRTPATIARTSR